MWARLSNSKGCSMQTGGCAAILLLGSENKGTTMKQPFTTGLLLLGLILAGAVHADSVKEASMVVTGSITVGPDGTVQAYRLDHVDKLPKGARQTLATVVPNWRFEPPTKAGEPVTMRSRMSIRLVARELEDASLTVAIGDTSFRDADGPEIAAVDIPRFDYPGRLIRQRVAGTVYLLLQLDAHGRVRRAAARQVNLRTYGSPSELRRWRKRLASAVLSVVQEQSGDFHFSVPAAALKPSGYAVVCLPVDFSLGGPHKIGYGQWDTYLRGPSYQVPWAAPALLAGGIDSVAPNAVHQLGADSLTLLPSGSG